MICIPTILCMKKLIDLGDIIVLKAIIIKYQPSEKYLKLLILEEPFINLEIKLFVAIAFNQKEMLQHNIILDLV